LSYWVIELILFQNNFRMEKIRSFEDLACWKKARGIRVFVHEEIIKRLPKSEFDMTDNMKRAARSCTRNIAEGFGRFHYQENIQFCRISRGSMFELLDDLLTCTDEKYIDTETLKRGRTLIEEGIKILNGYIKYLSTAKHTSTSNNR